MSSIFSTQKRQTFLRRKYCFFPTAAALSPPVGRCEAAIGRPPPLGSGIMSSPSFQLRPAPWERERQAPDAPEQERRAGDARRLPPHRPTSVAPAKAAEPRPADVDARAFHAPSFACRDASAFRLCERSGT